MRIIHSGGFPDDERRQNRAVIYSNIIIAFKILLDIMDTEQIPFENEETKVGISGIFANFAAASLAFWRTNTDFSL